MSVLLDTSAGELVVDLFTDECPLAATNFLKLCKIKYYNGCLLFNVQQNYICQTGDPTGTGVGGQSVYGLLQGGHAACFADEIVKHRKMNKVGLICMAHDTRKENANRSQFFITLRGEDLDNLEGRHTVFGEVAEGMDVLAKINELYCDGDGRPFQDVRIKHTYVLDDPFPDPAGLIEPPASPVLQDGGIPHVEKVKKRIPYEEGVETEVDGRTEAELEESIRKKEAQSRAIVLEMTGDLPDADIKPPDEVLFVCKLNPITTDADLELIFSRFGKIKQCEIIRDSKTGDSLNYAFIEFETEKACIEAYEKMNNVLIDDRRIKVDFSQSVSKLWNRFAQRPRAPTGAGGSGGGKPSAAGNRGPGGPPVKSQPQVQRAAAPPVHTSRPPPPPADSVRRPEPDQHRQNSGWDRDTDRRRDEGRGGGDGGGDGGPKDSSSYRRRSRSDSRDRRRRDDGRNDRDRRDRDRSRSRSRDRDRDRRR